MAYAHTYSQSLSGSGASITNVNSYAGDARGGRHVELAADQTHYLVDFVLNVSEIKSFYMVSSQDLTIKTNDSGAPADTIVLKANKPLIWQHDSLHANPFSEDITALYLTNTLATVFQLEVVFDSTPA